MFIIGNPYSSHGAGRRTIIRLTHPKEASTFHCPAMPYSGAVAQQFWREFILSYCEHIFTWLPVPALPLVSLLAKSFPQSFGVDLAVPHTPYLTDERSCSNSKKVIVIFLIALPQFPRPCCLLSEEYLFSPFLLSPFACDRGQFEKGGGGEEHEKAISMHTAATHARTRPGRRRAICIEYGGLCCTEKSRKTCTSRDPFLPSGYTQYVYCRQHILGRYKCGHERPSCVRGKKSWGRDNVSGGGGGGGKGRRSYLHCMDLCLYSLRSFISGAVYAYWNGGGGRRKSFG